MYFERNFLQGFYDFHNSKQTFYSYQDQFILLDTFCPYNLINIQAKKVGSKFNLCFNFIFNFINSILRIFLMREASNKIMQK